MKKIGENINDVIDLLEGTKLYCDELKMLINSFPCGSPESLNEYIDELNVYMMNL